MSYTPERFMADSGITRDEVEAEKRRMLEEIRLHELKEARIRRHPRLVGARRKIMKVPMPFRAHGPRPCRIGRGSFRA